MLARWGMSIALGAHLRKQFMPQIASESLKGRAQMLRSTLKNVPDATITPASPEFEKMQRRLKR